MKRPHIMVIDDQVDVLSAIMKDLDPFREKFILDDCQSAQEAIQLLEELEDSGEDIALIICDHIMPQKNGIAFLIEISKDDRFEGIRKVLVTGQASHSDTIEAINKASIDYYVSKPWDVETLHCVVKQMITAWVIDQGLDFRTFDGVLDPNVLLQRVKREGGRKG